MSAGTITLIGIAFTVMGSVIATYFTYRASRASNTASPYAELAKDIVALRVDYRRLSERVEALEGRDRRWVAFYDDLTYRWAQHRTNQTPPARPDLPAIPAWHE
ncbi:hypothetical protein [uncultured Arsenicicoccus sp.]|uniref:hypothetical protein n=1 Tax=uncultured Arsenicicoccus sp. TaxID=491339 RepID=UPI0025933B7F|nr:hypothetical protein [uncultured Arsenicicoccus sp.]